MKLHAAFPAGRDIDRILCNELTQALRVKLYVDYDGSIRIYRQGRLFAEIAHILIKSDTDVRPYFRYYVPKKTISLINQTIAHSLETRSLDILKPMLSDRLPQEWLVNEITQTTCHGSLRFLRVESEPKTNGKRHLVCLINVQPSEIIVFTQHITSPGVNIAIDRLKQITIVKEHFQDRCLTLTECPLFCESCPNAATIYQ
jgi:hypothetical protein